MENMKHDTMIKNGQANATSMKQSSATAMDSMQGRVWHEQGVATFSIDEITDPWLRQAITNEANRRWGRRIEGNNHGR
jgi:spore germination cell wall hydrolase CwlJ-like protein